MPDSASPAVQTPATIHNTWWKNPALYLALAALGFSGWHYKEQTDQYKAVQAEVAKRLSADEDLTRQVRASVEKVREQAEQTQQRITQLENKMGDAENQYISLEALYQQLSRNPDEISLAEAEQTIGIANQQLQLAGNPKAALIALQAADSRLARNDKPQWIALRKSINADIEKLRALPQVDMVGMNLQLNNLILECDALPFVIFDATRTDKAAEKPVEGLLARVWEEAKQLVKVRKLDAPDPAFYAPSQSYFLRENLKLHLLSARLALLSRDEGSFRADLNAAHELLGKYFDTQSQPVVAAMNTLKHLSENVINIALPELDSTVDTVKRARQVREKAATK
ncbi:MAG: uroporphyrinogen-III C-methyltransferase [Burkholderiales bacterium]